MKAISIVCGAFIPENKQCCLDIDHQNYLNLNLNLNLFWDARQKNVTVKTDTKILFINE